MFAVNSLPKTKDISFGFFRRPLINLYGAERENQKLSQSAILERLGHAGIKVVKTRPGVKGAAKSRPTALNGIGVNPELAEDLLNRASSAGLDGRKTVSIGGRRVDVMDLMSAWGILKRDDPEVSDPEIARVFAGGGKGDSTWI